MELVTTSKTLAQGMMEIRIDVVAYALVVTVSTDMIFVSARTLAPTAVI
jgi:hypothetical protein